MSRLALTIVWLALPSTAFVGATLLSPTAAAAQATTPVSLSYARALPSWASNDAGLRACLFLPCLRPVMRAFTYQHPRSTDGGSSWLPPPRPCLVQGAVHLFRLPAALTKSSATTSRLAHGPPSTKTKCAPSGDTS